MPRDSRVASAATEILKRSINRDQQYSDDDACLERIFNLRYGKDYQCPKCHKRGFYRNRARKCYSCAWCGYDHSPLAGTIFHKSPTSLKNWVFAIFLMGTPKNGVAAKEIQRQTNVTYKTAWRIQRQIRKLMMPDASKLGGTIEIDDTYIGAPSSMLRHGEIPQSFRSSCYDRSKPREGTERYKTARPHHL